MQRNIGVIRQCFMVLVGLCLLLGFSAPSSLATPPEKIELRYNYASQTLLVTITHESNRGNHYIKTVDINKNGSIVGIETYTSQPPGGKFTYVYKIQALDDDAFEVTATCSRGDSNKSGLYTVRQQ